MEKRLTLAVAVLAALPLLYVGSYFALARHGVGITNGGATAWAADYAPLPSEAGRIVFDPLHRVDRHWLRPAYWCEEDNPQPFRLHP